MATPLELAPGDRLSHPTHGACVLRAFAEKRIAGKPIGVALLVRESDGVEVSVPRDRLAELGIRKLAAGEAATPMHVDPELGAFTWDARLSRWTQKGPFTLSISPLKLEGAALFDAVRPAALRLEQRRERVRGEVADKLLALHNRVWNQSGRPETREGFAARIALEALDVNEDGTATAYFSDGDLFWGHTIEVFLDASGHVEDAHPAG